MRKWAKFSFSQQVLADLWTVWQVLRINKNSSTEVGNVWWFIPTDNLNWITNCRVISVLNYSYATSLQNEFLQVGSLGSNWAYRIFMDGDDAWKGKDFAWVSLPSELSLRIWMLVFYLEFLGIFHWNNELQYWKPNPACV